MRKQKKVKLNLVSATYRDYVRHFGVKEGAKKWRERKKKSIQQRVQEGEKIIVIGAEKLPPLPGKDMGLPVEDLVSTEEVKEVPIEKTPLEKAEDDIEVRGKEINKMVGTKGWYQYLKPEVEQIINNYKEEYDRTVVNKIPSVDTTMELNINLRVRNILQAILDYPKDCLDDAEIVKKERKERENATNSGG